MATLKINTKNLEPIADDIFYESLLAVLQVEYKPELLPYIISKPKLVTSIFAQCTCVH